MDRRLTVLETRFDTLLPTLATKSDLEALRSEFRAGLEKLRGDFSTEMQKMRGDFSTALEKLRADQLKVRNDYFMKWIIGICVGLFVAMIGFDIAILNALDKIEPAKEVSATTAAPLPPSNGGAR